MYDKQTIISAFDKRGTLVQWLKNLDETLKNSTLDRIEKIETETSFAFKFVFANGVEMLTPTVEILDESTLNELARALKTPVSAPASTEIVAVDNTGAQTMLTVGAGLSIESGALKSTGGGGGGGVYRHYIKMDTGLPYEIIFDIYTSNSEPLNSVVKLINILGTSNNSSCTYNGSDGYGTGVFYITIDNQLYFDGVLISGNNVTAKNISNVTITNVSDTVKQV